MIKGITNMAWLDTQLLTSEQAIPDDINKTGVIGEQTLLYDPLKSLDRRTLKELDNNGALQRILKNTEIDIALRTIGNAFFPRVITLGTSPTVVIAPNRSPRGYIIINANTSASGITASETLFAAATVLPVATTNSVALSVGGYETARFILNVTEASAGANTSFNLQTQDPISGNWATAQSDIFQFAGGGVAVGTYYANVGGIGVDDQMRIEAVVDGDTMTCSLACILKPALSATIAGATAFIGGPDVNTTIGFPLLSGTRETFYLKENTAIYGVATGPLNLNVFELQ